jgi:sterol desaturase/sphingolipid hydroxylase (fatty acid hydroxylase superfamily)
MGMNPRDRQPDPVSPRDDAWLARPSTIRLLWWVFAAVLALSVAAEAVFKVKGYFGLDEWLGFGAVYGFLACLAMVLVAKALGWVLKRKENYYAERRDD